MTVITKFVHRSQLHSGAQPHVDGARARHPLVHSRGRLRRRRSGGCPLLAAAARERRREGLKGVEPPAARCARRTFWVSGDRQRP
eukprot:2635271-Prymnesium_polylepis.2